MSSICNCGKPIHPMRVEFGFDNCIDCANVNPVEPPKGRMVYDGKVGAQIEIMSAETWRENKGYFILIHSCLSYQRSLIYFRILDVSNKVRCRITI